MKQKHQRQPLPDLEYIQHVNVGPFAGYLWLQREARTLFAELVEASTARTVGLVQFEHLDDLKPLAKCLRRLMKEQPSLGATRSLVRC